MNGTRESTRRRSSTGSDTFPTIARSILLGLFLLGLGVLIARMFISLPLPAGEGLWQSGVLILALASTLASLCAQLPMQNALLAAVIIGCIGSAIHSVGSLTGIPFGPFFYTRNAGPQLFNTLSWSVPFVWIIAILNSRGVARLILRPWRKLRVYGYWLITLTALLTLLFDCGLEPFATRVEHLWLWMPMKLTVDWYGAPLTNFLGWLLTALLILAFATPALMKKTPAKSRSHYDPLIVWIAANLLFIAGSISQHLWLATAVNAVACICVVPFAIRGARW